jgi:hypothetical protein
MHFGIDGWAVFPTHRMLQYKGTWSKLASQALEKLRAGDWVAAGISVATGPSPVPIDTDLWYYLQLKDYVEEAEGAGFHFIALTVTEVHAPRQLEPLCAQPQLRRQLTQWIERQLFSREGPIRKADLLKQARAEFEGRTITNNMFATSWTQASFPESKKFSGRPKA